MNNPNHISQEEIEKIEQFVLNKMSGQQAEAFRKELEQSPALRDKYAEVKILIEAVEEGALRENMEQFHHQMETEFSSPKSTKKLNPYYWAAAAAIVLCIASVVWILYPRETEHQKLFVQFYQEDPGLITAMSSEGQYEFDRAMVDYKSGNYREAIERWEKLIVKKTDNDTLNYFLGVAHLALEETGPAISYFEKVSQLPEGRFSDDNYWYMALAYLKQGKVEEAVSKLEKTEHPMKEQLLKSLQEK